MTDAPAVPGTGGGGRTAEETGTGRQAPAGGVPAPTGDPSTLTGVTAPVGGATAPPTGPPSRPLGSRTRRGAVGLLVVVFAVLLSVTYVVSWTHYVVLSQKGFERTVVPMGTDPAVTAAAAATLTDQIFTSLDAEQRVANALPPQAGFLAGPITNAVHGYVQTGVADALQSDQFKAIWKQAVDFAHAQLLSVLNGDSTAVTTTNGQVVLNLVPLLNTVLQRTSTFVSGVVGKPVTLPTITGDQLPATVCQQLSTALGRPVPATCGQIPLFPAEKLTQARRTVRLFNGVRVLLLILTPLVAAAALWLSRRRRRTLLQLSVAGLLALVVERRVVHWLTTTLVNTGRPANRSARSAILTRLFHQYFSISRWLLAGLLATFVVALLTGPYPWAVALRRRTARIGRGAGHLALAATGRPQADATTGWVRGHLDLLRVLGVGVAVLLIVALSVSWVGLLVLAVLLAGYEWGLQRIGQSPPAALAGAAAAEAPSTDGHPGP